MKNINTVALEELWKKDTDGFLPVLIELFNPDLVWTDDALMQDNGYLRVVNDVQHVMYGGKRYMAAKVEFEPPEEDGQKMGTASLSITALDSRIPQLLKAAELPSEVSVKAFFAKKEYVTESGTTSEKYMFYPITRFKFQMKTATCSVTGATLSLTNDDILDLNLPRNQATSNMFPSYNVSS